MENKDRKNSENRLSKQTAKFIARIAENLPDLTSEQMQFWINNPKELQRVLKILSPEAEKQNDFSCLKIDCTPFNPETFIGKGWSIIEEDKRSLALTGIDLNKVVLNTTLKENEAVVTGKERLKRLKEENCIRLDANCFKTLWENQKLIPESWKKKTNGSITYIFFDGTVLQGPSYGNRFALYLYWDDGEWYWSYRWLDLDWDAGHPSALLAI